MRDVFGRKKAETVPDRPNASARQRLTIYLQQDTVYEFDASDGGRVVMEGFFPYHDPQFTHRVPEDDEACTSEGVFYCRLVGGTFHQADLQRPEFAVGSLVLIVPERSNPTDPHALMVHAYAKGRTSLSAGHIPRNLAAALAPLIPKDGGGLGVITQTVTKAGTRIGLRIIGSVGREMAIQMPAASIRLWG
jgi:hypothetical protein